MHELVAALSATWSPFVLVTGLLLIGHVAAREGLFRLMGSWCAKVPGGGVPVFLVTMLAVALVTAVLNLDTSVVFMTPVALQAARAKGTDETALLYGTVFMSNSASLLLIGSNLTNLLVFSRRGESGFQFAQHTALAWLVCVAITAAVILAWRWRALTRVVTRATASVDAVHVGPGVLAVLSAVIVMLVLRRPAPWVLALGVAATIVDTVVRRRPSLREVWSAINPVTLTILFVVASLVGWLARATSWANDLVAHANQLSTVLIAASSAIVVNNLPAASFFAAHRVLHPYALLVGLDLGPNVVVTGALSSLLWLRIARRGGSRVSVVTFTVVGSIISLLAMGGALVVLS